MTLLRDGDRVLMYYKGANLGKGLDPTTIDCSERDRGIPEVSCLAVSQDGIHFERLQIGRIESDGSKGNNILWDGPQYFTPFLDDRPGVPKSERFKALSGHAAGSGLGVYASADGIQWSSLCEKPVITKGAFDSQNLAFWDPVGNCFRAYYRASEKSGPRRGVRGIMTCTSEDFLHWSEPEHLEYTDDFPMHLYTNCIMPYERAPHILVGTPGRIVPGRKKLTDHPDDGVTDAILLAGRGGKKFHRWLEAFIRPSLDPLNWADRNTFPAWGMIQTSPEELSLYWCEHNGFPTMSLRRGVMRTDGFVSLHAGFDVGELLSVPMVFQGNRLSLNYSTSAAGTIRVELCCVDGTPLPGCSLGDSDLLFGNALEQPVTWNGSADVSEFSGQPVRLRIRLQDADVFSFQFQDQSHSG